MPQNSYEGKMIAERYKLAKVLGKTLLCRCEIRRKNLYNAGDGTFGEVLLAHRVDTGEKVAVKR